MTTAQPLAKHLSDLRDALESQLQVLNTVQKIAAALPTASATEKISAVVHMHADLYEIDRTAGVVSEVVRRAREAVDEVG